MKRTTIIAFLLFLSSPAYSNTLSQNIDHIESEWAITYYSINAHAQSDRYKHLILKTKKWINKYPAATELQIWLGILTATNAAFESPFTALTSIKRAKLILENSIQANPYALDGAAFIALGSLYYMTPGWPISFGNEIKARQLLTKGLAINPNSIDANYFLGDYFLSNNEPEKAQKYFEKALAINSRNTQQYADEQLKKEAALALSNTKQRRLDAGKNRFFSLFFSAKSSLTTSQ